VEFTIASTDRSEISPVLQTNHENHEKLENFVYYFGLTQRLAQPRGPTDRGFDDVVLLGYDTV
jgi:hypothetical protein